MNFAATNPLAYGLLAAALITAAVGLAAAVRWCVGELRRGRRRVRGVRT